MRYISIHAPFVLVFAGFRPRLRSYRLSLVWFAGANRTSAWLRWLSLLRWRIRWSIVGGCWRDQGGRFGRGCCAWLDRRRGSCRLLAKSVLITALATLRDRRV